MDEPLVPLSVLSLDLDQPAGADWPTYLRGRGIEVTFDDIGRPAVSREVARRLLTERRESEARARKTADARDKLHQAQWVAPRGLPAGAVPEGLSPAAYMGLSDRPGGRRTTLDAGSLFGDGDSLEFHPYPREAE
jgi:hypothetical protein